MSKPESDKYLVLNRCDQPVELHLSERVAVLTPYGTTELDEDEVKSPQLQALADQRLITVEKKESNAGVAAAKESSAREPARKKATKKMK